MDDAVRRVLCDIIKNHGHQLCEKHRQVHNLLSDLCPGKKTEINLICAALEFGIYSKLKTIDKSLVTVSLDRFSHQFEQEYSKKTSDARWAMGVWATVLSYISEDEFRKWHPYPPTVATLKPLISEESVILRGQLLSLGTASEVTASFLFGTSSKDYSMETSMKILNSEGYFSSEPICVSQFEFGRSYYCKTKAIGNKEAISNKGVRFYIPNRLAISTLVASEVTAYSAKLRGKLESPGNEKSVNCFFEYAAADSYNSEKTECKILTSSGEYEIDINDLKPGNSYRFCARADGQTSAHGLWENFITQKISPIIQTGDADVCLKSAKVYGEVESLGSESELALSIEYGTVKGIYINSSRFILTKTTGKFTFDISELRVDTHYYYRVKVVGSSEWYGIEKQFNVPSIPASFTIGNTTVSGTSAIIRGKLRSLGTSNGVKMQVGFKKAGSGAYNRTDILHMNSPGNFIFKLDNLQSRTKYSFVIKADGDTEQTSSEYEFVTWINISVKLFIRYLVISVVILGISAMVLIEILKKPPVIETPDPSGVTSNSAVLWTKLYSLGSASSVKLSFELGNEPGKYIEETLIQRVDKPGTYSYSLANLESGKTYYYRAKAVGDKTSYGDEKTFNISYYQPQKITTEECENSNVSAILKGKLVSLGSSSMVRTSFAWWSDPSYPSETAVLMIGSPGLFSTKLTDLKPNTTYFYQAKGQGDRETVKGEIKSFITSTKPPSITTGNGSATAFSALLRASLSSMGTATHVAVSFEYGTDRNNLNQQTPSQEENSIGSYSTKILNLSPGTTYYFRAKAVGDDTGYGDIQQIRTTIGNESPYQ